MKRIECSTDHRLGNPASQADRVLLTGETTAPAQRAACERLGITYHQRAIRNPWGASQLVDECTVFVDSRIYERIILAEKARAAETGCHHVLDCAHRVVLDPNNPGAELRESKNSTAESPSGHVGLQRESLLQAYSV